MKKISYYRQRGVVSLIVSLLSLVLATTVVIYVNRTTISEILSQQNQQKSRYARDAAEAGVAYVIAQINANPNNYLVSSAPYIVSGASPIRAALPSMTVNGNAIDLKQKFDVSITRSSSTSPIQITSVGGYDCGNYTAAVDFPEKCKSSATLTLLINIRSGMGFGPTDAMVTLGDAVFSGSSCIEGGEGGNAVHSGGTTKYAKNYSGDGCTDNNGKGAYGNTFQKDGNLASMEGNGVETLQKELYGQTGAQLCANSLATPAMSAGGTIDIGNLAPGGIYCFTGTFKITGNGTAGSAANPALIYINGSAEIAGTPVINGILHTTGSTTLTGNVTVNGSLISNGAITQSSGNLKVIYTDYGDKLFGPSDANYRVVAGSWKDW